MLDVIKGHTHHIAVHFVVAGYSVALAFAALYLLTGNEGFDVSSFYTLGASLVATPLAFVSGVHIWRANYKGRWAKIFKRKFFGGLILAALGVGMFDLRYVSPDLLSSGDAMTMAYLAMLALSTVCVSVLGYYGGKLVFK